MSLGLSICWRGPPGAGKRHALQQQLQLWASSFGQHFVLKKQSWDAPLQGGEDTEDAEESSSSESSALLPMEYSILHWGFDVARMSLQDKQFIKSILHRWGRGAQVLSSSGHSKRCLVFYHAHLLSNESVLFLQAFLEQNHEDTVLWMTSEYPLPVRLADWCIEIPVAGPRDKSVEALKLSPEKIHTIEQDIHQIYTAWMNNPAKLSDVKQIRAIVYALLHRNIRWVDGFHHWMFALEALPLTQVQRLRLGDICKQQPFTGSGQTVPSYRIPVLWENYLCQLRDALAPIITEAPPLSTVSKNTKKKKDAVAGRTQHLRGAGRK